MKFEYRMEANISKGQELFGIIAVSIYTYDGVHPVTVYRIDYTNEEVIFEVDQPCGYVYCSFREMEYFVFETEEEARDMMHNLEFGEGMWACDY